MKTELIYPVIVLPKKNNRIYVYFKDKDLKSTNEQLLQKINYNNLYLIDSVGFKYKIKRAFKVKYRGLWGFNPLFKGRQILIDFEFVESGEKILLSDFKEDIISRVNETKEFWKSAWKIEDLKDAVKNCMSFEDIAHLLK